MISHTVMFKKGSGNKILKYSIYIQKDTSPMIILSDGYDLVRKSSVLGGKDRVEVKTFTKGKVNRTPLEQARLEANSFIEKKKDEGYKTLTELGIINNVLAASSHYVFKDKKYALLDDVLRAALENTVITDTEGRIKPMLLHKALISGLTKEEAKGRKKIKYPCLAQVKKDGVCALSGKTSGFWSRGGKSGSTANGISWNDLCPELKLQMDKVFEEFPDRIFHGEIYYHGENLDTIGEALKQVKPLTQLLEFHIFDVVENIPFQWRDPSKDVVLKAFIDSLDKVKITKSKFIKSEEELLEFEELALNRGYEGIVVRHLDDTYEVGKRSSGVLKLVRFDETEVEIVDVIPMENRPDQGLFVCKYQGKTFNVTPSMTSSEKKFLLAAKYAYIGKHLTIKHRGFTKYGVPRIATGKTIRDYE